MSDERAPVPCDESASAPCDEAAPAPCGERASAPCDAPASSESAPSPAPRRRRTTLLLVLLGVAVVLAVALWGLSQDGSGDDYRLATDGTLTVASSLDCSPYASEEGGMPSGYDIAVIQEVANRLGLSCSIEQVPADDLVSAVGEEGGFDVAIAALSTAYDGADGIAFTDSYCLADQAIVVLGGVYESADDLVKCKIAAVEGTAGFDYAESLGASVLACDDAPACFTALEKGSVAALVVDASVAKSLVSQHEGCRIIERVATSDPYAIAVAADNPALTQAINEALASMADDGTLAELQGRYL